MRSGPGDRPVGNRQSIAGSSSPPAISPSSKSPLGYQLHNFKPGVYTELYLPKKAEYQGALYNALTSGFRAEEVKRHFSSSSRRKRILHFLEPYAAALHEIRKTQFAPYLSLGVIGQSGYVGYSMYEVDGVFWSEDRYEIDEERTQVVRLIFQPPISSIFGRTKFKADIDINSYVAAYLSAPPGERRLRRERVPENERRFLEKIDEWRTGTAIFLFGFLVYRICEHLERLHVRLLQVCNSSGSKTQKAVPKPPEDTIWVTTLWNLCINEIRIP